MKYIGLKRLTVKLLPHSKKWKEVFELEAEKLRRLFSNVDHIGSTSIKGIRAKPVIDMIAGIPSMVKLEGYIKLLKKSGYEFRPAVGNKRTHLFFVKGNENNRTHYLHLVKYNGKIWKNDLYFRDYLNKNRKAAKTYERLKVDLAAKFADDRTKYTKAKGKFIREILAKRG